jgi:hypothetical protein
LRRRDAVEIIRCAVSISGAGEFDEGRRERIYRVGIHAEFVVAAMVVLHDACPVLITRAEWSCFQAAHRPHPGLQEPVIGFDRIIPVLVGDVARGGCQLLDHSRVDWCPVGAHLSRAQARRRRISTACPSPSSTKRNRAYSAASRSPGAVPGARGAGRWDWPALGRVRGPAVGRHRSRRPDSWSTC